MKEWYSGLELAELALPGMPGTDRGIRKRATCKEWRSRSREERGGGLEYHISALPTAAQIKLTLLEKKAARQPEEPTLPAATRDELWRWYDAQPDTKKAKAKERAEVLDAVLLLHRGGVVKDVAVMNVAQHHGVGPSSVYNWFALVAGRDRADWLPCLTPRHAGRTATVDCDPAAWDMLKSDYLRYAGPAFSDCYRRVQRAAAVQGWSMPSERTLLRRLQATVNPMVVTLCREGPHAAERMIPAQERDKTALHALEGVNADGHRWDVRVEWPDKTVHRPCMIAFQDIYSGMFLSWRIDQTMNSSMARLALGDLVEDYGIPKHCVFDNGREFTSKWLTGGATHRFRGKIKEEDPIGILPQLGTIVHFTTPYHGQAKPIERGWRDFANTIARHPAFEGAYTGNGPLTKPENYGSRAIPLAEFEALVASEINEHNDRAGRRSRVCNGRSFREVFEASYRDSAITKITEEQRRLWMLAAEGLNVDSRDGSLKLFGNRYAADFLLWHRGEKVAARFDPDFLHDGLHIYRLNGAYLGHAPVIEASGFFNADAAREVMRQRRTVMRAIKAQAEAEVRMSAARVAAMVPVNHGPEAPPEAKVVALPRPVLDLKQTPQPVLTDAQAERREALVTEFRRPDAAPTKDEKTLRLEKAARIEAAIAAGAATEDEAGWFGRYSRQPEWKAFKRLAEDFSASAQATA